MDFFCRRNFCKLMYFNVKSVFTRQGFCEVLSRNKRLFFIIVMIHVALVLQVIYC